jgi:VanZ family protein
MFEKTSKRNLFASVFALLTVGSMALFYNLYEPWQAIGSELIPDGSFSSPSATNVFGGWSDLTQLVPDGGFNGSPGVVLAATPKRKGTLRFTVYNLTNIPAFRVSLRATAYGVTQGKEGYNVPKAVFYYRDTNSKSLYKLHHGVVNIPKDTKWQYYKDFFPVPKDTIDARFHIENDGIAGVMQVDDLSVIPVKPRRLAPLWKLIFGTLWFAAFVLCLSVLRPWTRRYGFMIMATLFLIIVGIILPGKPLDDAIEKTAHSIKKMIPKPVEIVSHPAEPSVEGRPIKLKEEVVVADKSTATERTHVVGHFMLFSLLAFLSALSWITAPSSFKRAVAVLAGLIFFATATEVLQFIPPDRSAGLSDLSIDVTGMTSAVILVLCLRGIQRLINGLKLSS